MTSRFAIVGATALTLSAGCVGDAVTNGGGKKHVGDAGTSDGTTTAQPDMAIDQKLEFSSKVLPLLTQDCGTCHAQSGGSYPPFLVAGASEGSTVYDTFVAWPSLVGTTPETSEILTKPAHEGGPTYASDNSPFTAHVPVITQWIVDFNAQGGHSVSAPDGGMLAITTPTLPQMGQVNSIDLGQLGSMYAGMKLTFTPTLIGTSLIQLQDVTLDATATSTGVTVQGTVVAFFTPPDLKDTQAIDTDFNTDTFTAYAGGTGLLGTTITAYTMGQYIGFSFTSIAVATGTSDMGGTTASCKDVTDFATFKKDLLGQNGMNLNCSGCHNTGGSGNSAFNMGGFGTTANDAASCLTMLNYVNIQTPNMSDAYLVVSGGKTHQGGTLTSTNQTTFLNALTTWLNGEK